VSGIARGELLKGRYRLERLLGRGGMAAVWLGEDEVLERPVAVKVLSDTIASDPEYVARFRREARTAAGINHPNLVGVFDYADGEERPYLVMQFVPGEDLGQVLARGGRVDCERLACELLDALAHIHARGILHRDVKPGNILIDGDGSAKLIDFGIAQPADATSLTRTGLILGTERYAAPEVMEGKQATERSDLYSCGVVLRSCLDDAGGRADLRSLAEWLTSREPAARPASARQALARLERRRRPGHFEEPTQAFAPVSSAASSDGGAPPSQSPGPRLEPAPSRSRGNRWLATLAITGVIAALVAAVVVLSGGDGGRAPSAHAKQAKKKRAARQSASAEGAAQSVAAAVTPQGNDPARGSVLNEEGFALIQAGEYEAAVPVLEEAVRSFPPGTEDIDYAYALYNLGDALRLSGQPEAAIPILERRLEIPDQTETVAAELEAARREAG
jgi:serine/threonine protein kinase